MLRRSDNPGMGLRRAVAGVAAVLASWLAVQLPVSAAPIENFGAAAVAAPAALPVAYRTNITMQAQQQNQWCWAAAGNTIAAYHGVSVTQNYFCALAKNRNTNLNCPNDQGTLADAQNALRKLGFAYPGNYVWNTISYAAVQNQMAANQPVETRIQWKSGGGHMHTIYGYDTSKSWVYWGDPWPSSNRYNWATYNYYLNNSSFSWTHTLTGIKK